MITDPRVLPVAGWFGIVAFVVLLVVVFVLAMVLLPDDRRGRNVYGAYLFAAIFAALAIGGFAVRGLASAVAHAVVDPPIVGIVCAGAEVERIAQRPPEPFEPPEIPPFERPEIPPIEPPEFPPFEPPEIPPFEPPEIPPFETGFDCEPISGRDRAPGLAIHAGLIGLAAGTVVWTHASRARRLMSEQEVSDD